MGLNALPAYIFGFFRSGDPATIIILLAVAVLFYVKPKPMLKLAALVAVIAVVLYLVSLMGGMTSTGVSEKSRMVHTIR